MSVSGPSTSGGTVLFWSLLVTCIERARGAARRDWRSPGSSLLGFAAATPEAGQIKPLLVFRLALDFRARRVRSQCLSVECKENRALGSFPSRDILHALF